MKDEQAEKIIELLKDIYREMREVKVRIIEINK